MDLLKDQGATQEADNPWRASLGTSTSAHIPENIPTLIEQAKSGNPSLYYLRPLIADNTRSMKLSKHGCSFECGAHKMITSTAKRTGRRSGVIMEEILPIVRSKWQPMNTSSRFLPTKETQRRIIGFTRLM
jgi:hypothetical protein